MANPLYQQLNPQASRGGIIDQIQSFKKAFSGDPRQMIQEMLNSGKISQSQLNQNAQKANEIYRQFRGLI